MIRSWYLDLFGDRIFTEDIYNEVRAGDPVFSGTNLLSMYKALGSILNIATTTTTKNNNNKNALPDVLTP